MNFARSLVQPYHLLMFHCFSIPDSRNRPTNTLPLFLFYLGFVIYDRTKAQKNLNLLSEFGFLFGFTLQQIRLTTLNSPKKVQMMRWSNEKTNRSLQALTKDSCSLFMYFTGYMFYLNDEMNTTMLE